MLAIDFETHLISSEHPAPKPVCVSWYDGKNSGLFRGKDMEPFLKKALANRILVAHNMKFELSVIYAWFPDLRADLDKGLEEDRFMCTQINEKLLNCIRKIPVNRTNLAALVDNYFKEDISDTKTDPNAWRLRYSELEDVDIWPQDAIDYAINDSIWCYKVAELQLAPLDVVDPKRVELLDKEIVALVTPARNNLIKHGFMKEVKGEFKKSAKLFAEHISKVVPPEHIQKTIKGNISTSEESLDKYSQAVEDPIISSYIDVMEYANVQAAFVKRLKTANPHIRTEYGAVIKTGRTHSRSSDLYPSVNIQQMPREVKLVTYDIRNCYVPRPGYKICSIDYSGLELASAASQLYKYFGESRMRDAINSGDTPIDMHSMLAHRIMSLQLKRDVSYEEFLSNKKEGDYKKMRQISKAVNLGFPGGLGFRTMRGLLFKEGIKTKYKVLSSSPYENIIRADLRKFKSMEPNLRCERTGFREYSLVYDELVTLKGELFDLYPELGLFLTEKHEMFKTGEKKRMKDEFGEWVWEEMYSYDVGGFKRDHCTYTEFCNGYLMQSPSAIGAKRAIVNTIKKYRGTGKVNCLAFIHDEIVFEVKDCPEMLDYVKDVAFIMIDSMQTVLKGVRIAVEADVMDYWKKSGGFHVETFFKDPTDTGVSCRPNMQGLGVP